MSRETDAMQFVLDLLTDGILTSTVQQIGYTPHDKVVNDQLPFVQVYSGITENQEREIHQPPGTLQFNLEIIDVRGQMDSLRDVIEALDQELRVDKGFGATVEKGFLTARTVAERKDDERSIVGAVVTVQIRSGLLDPVFTVVTDLSVSGDLSVSVAGEIRNSLYVRRTTGVRKVGAGTSITVTSETASGAPNFPMDLSGVKRLRLFYYTNTVYRDQIDQVLIRIRDSSGNDATYQPVGGTFPSVGAHGWKESVYDPRDLLTGIQPDLSDVDRLRWQIFFNFSSAFTSDDYGFILGAFGYYLRDTGNNNDRGYRTGF